MKRVSIAVLAALSIAGPAMACNEGDPEVRVIAPFDLYEVGAIGRSPLGHFTGSGTACIDNNLNRGVTPPAGWSFVYFKQGLRDFTGIATLSAFEAIGEGEARRWHWDEKHDTTPPPPGAARQEGNYVAADGRGRWRVRSGPTRLTRPAGTIPISKLATNFIRGK